MKVAQEIFLNLINCSTDQISFLSICKELFEAQEESLRQLDPNISNRELERITYAKSSIAFLYYFTHMSGKISNELKEVIYHVAGLHQYSNDLNDIYKDSREKIITPANRCRDFKMLKADYIDRIRIQNQKIMSLPFPKKNKDHFCVMMNTINATAIGNINKLIKLQKENVASLDWNECARKDLIYDNAKPLNMIRWFYNIWKLSKLE